MVFSGLDNNLPSIPCRPIIYINVDVAEIGRHIKNMDEIIKLIGPIMINRLEAEFIT